MRDNPERFIESNTKNSWLRYLNNMCTQGTWTDAPIILQLVESNPVQERNASSTITISHIDGCHYVSTTAVQSNASISMCNELTNDTQSSRNTLFAHK